MVKALVLGGVLAAGVGALPKVPHRLESSRDRIAINSSTAVPETFAKVVVPPLRLLTDTGASARLHKRNPFDWVGMFHAQVLQHAGVGVLSSPPAATGCDRMVNYLASRPELVARFGSSQAIHSFIGFGLSMSHACGGSASEKDIRLRLRSVTNGTLPRTNLQTGAHLPAIYSLTALHARRSAHHDVTSAADPYFDAIDAAVDNAGDADSYASALSSILDDAESNLTGDDLDAVDAVASVGQSSFESWGDGTTGVSDAESMNSEYGSCIDEYAQQIIPDIISDCGISHHLINQRAKPQAAPRGSFSAPATLTLLKASAGRRLCGWDWRTVVHGDIAGAVGGAIAGAAGGGIGAGPGAAVGGASVSLGEAVWSDINYIICWWNS